MVMSRSWLKLATRHLTKQLLRTYGLFFNFAPMEKILVVPVAHFESEAILKGAESEIKPCCKCTLVES